MTITTMTLSFLCLRPGPCSGNPSDTRPRLWIDDSVRNLTPEFQESPADGVYHYLEARCRLPTCWHLGVADVQHDAVHRLLQGRRRESFRLMSLCCSSCGVQKRCPLRRCSHLTLRKRYPDAEDLIQGTEVFLRSKIPSFFHGTVHAEASRHSHGINSSCESCLAGPWGGAVFLASMSSSFVSFIASGLIFLGNGIPCYSCCEETLLALSKALWAHWTLRFHSRFLWDHISTVPSPNWDSWV